MTVDTLTAASQDFEIDVLKEPETAPQEEALLEIELAAEDVEPGEPAAEVLEADAQFIDEDPVRLYLHRIGVFPFLQPKTKKLPPAGLKSEGGYPQSNMRWKLTGIMLLPAGFFWK